MQRGEQIAKENNSSVTQKGKQQSEKNNNKIAQRGKQQFNKETKVWGEENRMREENRTQGQGEKKKWGLSWTQTPFYSRFKVFVFLGLMATPTTIFFPCNNLH